MQCRKCGSPMNETDTVCGVCGAVQEEKPVVHNEEFQWTVHDFSRPKKAEEEVKMEWPKDETRPRRNVDLNEPISFDIDVFKKRSAAEELPKNEPAAATVTEKEETAVEVQAETPAASAASTVTEEPVREKIDYKKAMEAIASEAQEESARKADQYFDFSKTNIEFQKLLDREYEKLQRRKEGVPYVEAQWDYLPEEKEETSAPAKAAAAAETAAPAEEAKGASGPELPESPEDALERMIWEGTRHTDVDNDATIKVDLSAIKRAAAKRYGYDSEEALNGVSVAPELQPKEEIPEESAPVEAPVNEPVEEPVAEASQVEELIPETVSETPVEKTKKRRTMTEMEKAREEYFRMLDDEMAGVKVKVEINAPYGQGGKVVTDVDIQSNRSEEPKKTHVPIYEEPEMEVKEENLVAAEATVVEEDGDQAKVAAAEAAKAKPDANGETMAAADEKKTETADTANTEEEPVWPLDPRAYEEEEERGGCLSVIGKLFLGLIAIVIALELAALGILYFIPESKAADTVYMVQGRIVEIMTDVKDRFLSGDDEESPAQTELDEENNEEQAGDDVQEPDPVPMADKEALIATQASQNTNIGSITANDDLKYKDGVDYGNTDLNNSKPIANNIWYTDENGAAVYLDREILGTLIRFNSQWVDYVNNGDKAVLNVTKEGSRAYKNAVGFAKVGKVKEEFASMEIGEIRQGGQGFYIWVKEQIKLTENGKVSNADYQWVYCLEAADYQMKIVDYIDVKGK